LAPRKAAAALAYRFHIPHSNKQFAFLQHYRGLQPGGAPLCAADNVLFESNVGRDIRRDLMDKCNCIPSCACPPASSMPRASRPMCCSSRARSDKDNTRKYGLRSARQHAQLWQAHRVHPQLLQGFEALSATTRLAGPKAWPNAPIPARAGTSAVLRANGLPNETTTWIFMVKR